MVQTINELATRAVADGIVPGISYSVFGPDCNEIHILGFQGWRADNLHLPLTADALYDLASLTKVVGTTTRLLQLLHAGHLKLTDHLGQYVPGCAQPDLTIEQLMLHRSGLPADVTGAHDMTRSQLDNAVRSATVHTKPGSKTEYSDLNYILLGEVVAALDGDLAAGVTKNVLAPLGMATSGYHLEAPLTRFVPTENRPARGGIVRGSVHDHKAFLMGGVSGHAGLFSTLGDLTLFTRVMAGLNESPALPEAVFTMLANHDVGGRTLGWRRWSHGQTYWHTGFTGTSIAFDRDRQTGFVCLTNRIYPTRENRAFLAVRRQMLTAFFGGESEWQN